jgi:adenine-specific DNA-methyltransferase
MPTLHWLTRDDDIRAAGAVPYRLLEEVPDLGYGDRDAGNMLIQGDNLDALKALLPFYAGQVKCIYIDPPYNTKSAFEHYDDNLEHTKWLAMMWPRLELLWDLLRNDGVILISINDDEGHYLKVICDEAFGRKNFVTTFVWNYEGNTDNQSKIIKYHEYILAYSKSGKIDDPKIIDPNIETDSKLYKPEIRNTIVKNGPKNPVSAVLLPEGFPSSIAEGTIRPNNRKWPRHNRALVIRNYKLTAPVEASSGWSSKEILEEFIANGFCPVQDSKGQETTFEITRTGAIEAIKKRGSAKGHVVSVLRGFGTTNQMRLLLEKLGIRFTFPKPVGLLEYLVRIFSNKDDIVLDSFLGSGTTAHAVLSANQTDGANRRFIGIEISEKTFNEVTRPRICAVVDGNSKAYIAPHGSGFRLYHLGEPAFDAEGRIRYDIRFPILAAHVWFSETGQSWNGKGKSPLLGLHGKQAYALLYNGILGDKTPKGGNVLTRKTLGVIRDKIARKEPNFQGTLVIYGEASRLSDATLARKGITFKQTPYDVKARL